MQKLDFQSLPVDGDMLCEEAGMYVEQAFLLLEKQLPDNENKAMDILRSQTNSQNIEKCIQIAMRFNKIDQLIRDIINQT